MKKVFSKLSPFKSSTGLSENFASFLCYLFAFIGGALFLAVEKRSRYVMFHSLQSLFLFGTLILGHLIAGFIPLVGVVVNMLLAVLGFSLWILLMLASLQGKWYKVPVVGDLAERQLRGL